MPVFTQPGCLVNVQRSLYIGRKRRPKTLMKFVDLPEPHISTSHVLTRTPLLYRFDARSEAASIVFSEHANRRPNVEVNGDPTKASRVFYDALGVLGQYGPNTPKANVRELLMPLFTLEVRPHTSFLANCEITLTGFSDCSVTCVTHGMTAASHLMENVKAVYARLRELGRVYYRT
jgi:hypothetical protein